MGGTSRGCFSAHSGAPPLFFKRFPTMRAGLGDGAHLSATDRAIQSQVYAASRTDRVLLADGCATLWAQGLPAGRTAPLAEGRLGPADRATLAEIKAALGAAFHLGCQLSAALGAAQNQLCATDGAGCVVFAHRCTAGRAERLPAAGTLGQPQAHIGVTGRTRPGGMESAVGAIDLFLFQEEVALGAGPLATLRAGPQFAAEFGSADRASQQHQSWRGSKDRG
jgi:hypothetical protein